MFCPFEGPSAEGSRFTIYVEWDGEIDEVELWDHLLEHKEKIRAFGEHSIDTDVYQELGEVSPEEVMELVQDPFNPDYALFRDGRVYEMEYIGECRWVE